MNLKKTAIVLFAASLGLAAALNCAAQTTKPDFSGKWILDKDASKGDGMDDITYGERIVEHKDPEIKIRRSMTFSAGSGRSAYALIIDGVERDEIPLAEEKPEEKKQEDEQSATQTYSSSEDKTRMKASWDGNRLIIESVTEHEGDTMRKTEIWTLSADGKTLTVDIVRKSEERGEDKKTEVYKKA